MSERVDVFGERGIRRVSVAKRYPCRRDPETGKRLCAVCGNPLLRLLLLSIDPSQDKDPNVDVACGVNGLLSTLPAPPGASS